ncbi:Os04g0371850 [Oryza sativa Japonica Group]|uniref:Os04g0371850 protein n=1 Tax=Oryza sativa subsp. japonica TaxID=39947 RepID=A0A0P0W9V9_ORYSJ|nr:Os04g0371850 [Oryza sativa Japonica Group]
MRGSSTPHRHAPSLLSVATVLCPCHLPLSPDPRESWRGTAAACRFRTGDPLSPFFNERGSLLSAVSPATHRWPRHPVEADLTATKHPRAEPPAAARRSLPVS